MLLLDTCALLWLAGDQGSLSKVAREAISADRSGLTVSAISIFEIARKVAHGELELPLLPDQWYAETLETFAIREFAIDGRTSLAAASLPPVHRDPCDRFIIATAGIHRMPIATPDPIIRRYPDVRVIW